MDWPLHITLEGSLDDEETIEEILLIAKGLPDNEQAHVKVKGVIYFVQRCDTPENIRKNIERRYIEDRRSNFKKAAGKPIHENQHLHRREAQRRQGPTQSG